MDRSCVVSLVPSTVARPINGIGVGGDTGESDNSFFMGVVCTSFFTGVVCMEELNDWSSPSSLNPEGIFCASSSIVGIASAGPCPIAAGEAMLGRILDCSTSESITGILALDDVFLATGFFDFSGSDLV